MSVTQFLQLVQGSLLTISLTVLATIFGIILGLGLALTRISKNKVLNWLGWIYIWIFRGTPLLLQILVIYFALPSVGIRLDPFPSAVLALSLNSGAYLAEIIRAAIVSIDGGQMEAAKALGMSYNQAMFKIIIPQSYRRLIPPVGNEMIMLLKDSSLVSIIGMSELLRNAKVMANNAGPKMFVFYGAAAGIYLFLTSILTVVFQKLEDRHSVYEK